MTTLAIFRLFKFVREATGQNHGLRVNAIQKWGGGEDGQSWCCWLVTMVLDLFFQGQSPVPRLGACEDVRQICIKNGWQVARADVQPGDLALAVKDGHAHHIAMVTVPSPLELIAGNTSSDGHSANGDGCYEHVNTIAESELEFYRVPGVTA